MAGTTPRERECTSRVARRSRRPRIASAAGALAAVVLAVAAAAPAPAAASTVALVYRGPAQNELGLVFRALRGERNRVTITMDEFAVTIVTRLRSPRSARKTSPS